MRGYAYDRRDVTGRGLANAYAQTLGTIFSSGGEKPYEVELFVAEVGDAAEDDQIYRLTYDGQVADEHGFAVMGGAAEHGRRRTSRSTTRAAPRSRRRSGWPSQALGQGESEDRVIPAGDLEVAVLDRTRTQPRKFRRLARARLAEVLGGRGVEQADEAAPEDALAGSGPRQSGVDDPADPTDQVSGATPPLEDPVTGEPPAAPPAAPPATQPPVAPPVAPPPPAPDSGQPPTPGAPPPPTEPGQV